MFGGFYDEVLVITALRNQEFWAYWNAAAADPDRPWMAEDFWKTVSEGFAAMHVADRKNYSQGELKYSKRTRLRNIQKILLSCLNLNIRSYDYLAYSARDAILCPKQKLQVHISAITKQKIFTVDVIIKGEPHGRGQGGSKKLAEQRAAKEALKLLGSKKKS